MEEWKDITGYEGLYLVSSLGRVQSLIKKDKPLILTPVKIGHKPKNLYLAVNMSKDGKQKQQAVHRLVALHFIDNPHHHPIINHKDENTFNNCKDNLEWCTNQYNQEFSLSKLLYSFIKPDGEVVHIKNLRKYSRENGLNHAHMYQVHYGRVPSYKGWRQFNEIERV